MPSFQLKKFLGSIFTPDFSLSNSLTVASQAYELMGERLDGPPTILPLLQDAPADIPRITLGTSDNTLKINISLSRTNFLVQVPALPETGTFDINEFAETASRFFSDFKNALSLRVQRMGFVTERLEVDPDALSYILNRFCNSDQIERGRPFHNSKRFEIHSLKKYEWEGFNINSWVRLKCLTIRQNNDESLQPILVVENDLNTLPPEENPDADFSVDEIRSYFSNSHEHISSIVDLYFN